MPPGFSWSILFTLILMLAASLTTYLVLVRRLTVQRHWLDLVEWAREHDLRASSASSRAIPSPLRHFIAQHGTIGLDVHDQRISLLQIHVAEARWNVLVAPLERAWPAAALRPASASASVIDGMGLSAFYAASTPRFTVLSGEARTAAALSRTSALALLPPDIGLLVEGKNMILDFSTRPFDPIELDRMLDVAQQIARAL